MGREVVGPGVSKVWVLTIGVLEVYPHWHTIRAQSGRARSALFSRVSIITYLYGGSSTCNIQKHKDMNRRYKCCVPYFQ